ncbi:hypothetical protein AB1Y20_015405 [Prymnesium parvum]|uniref:Uncharacterized protein n=1 Tax=Prymnesium parvum TaxID=97485 RepID=A0AB34K1B6_PRYPA
MVFMLLLPHLASCVLLPRVLFADCDGTMLGPDHRLSDRTRNTLQRLARAGVAVVPATGRAAAGPWTAHVLTEPSLKGGVPGIFMNGGMIVDSAGGVSSTLLPAEVAAATLAFARGEGVTTAFYCGKEVLVETPNELTAKLAAVGDAPHRTIEDLSSAVESVGKVLLLFDETKLDGETLRHSLERAVAATADITQALSWGLEVVPSGVNKATAARLLLDAWGISSEDAMAIGDGVNDVELLSFVGYGIAMGNGAKQAKLVAQYVAPSNSDEGFSIAMEELILAHLES